MLIRQKAFDILNHDYFDILDPEVFLRYAREWYRFVIFNLCNPWENALRLKHPVYRSGDGSGRSNVTNSAIEDNRIYDRVISPRLLFPRCRSARWQPPFFFVASAITQLRIATTNSRNSRNPSDYSLSISLLSKCSICKSRVICKILNYYMQILSIEKYYIDFMKIILWNN